MIHLVHKGKHILFAFSFVTENTGNRICLCVRGNLNIDRRLTTLNTYYFYGLEIV